MSTYIPTVIGSPAGAPTAPTAMDFSDMYGQALKRARLPNTDADITQAAKDTVNQVVEQLCGMVPEAPFMRKTMRLITDPMIQGATATWTKGSVTMTLGATEALTAAQILLYPGARIHSPSQQEWHFITAIDPTGQIITLDAPWASPTSAAPGQDTWQIFRDIYGLPGDFSAMVSTESPVGTPALSFYGECDIRELFYMGVRVGPPERYAYAWDGEGRRLLLLHPAPSDQTYIYTFTYTPLITYMVDDTDQPLLPAQYRQLVVFRTAEILAAELREDSQLAQYIGTIANKIEMKFLSQYAPERTGPRFKIPAETRMWRPRYMMWGGVRIDANDRYWDAWTWSS